MQTSSTYVLTTTARSRRSVYFEWTLPLVSPRHGGAQGLGQPVAAKGQPAAAMATTCQPPVIAKFKGRGKEKWSHLHSRISYTWEKLGTLATMGKLTWILDFTEPGQSLWKACGRVENHPPRSFHAGARTGGWRSTLRIQASSGGAWASAKASIGMAYYASLVLSGGQPLSRIPTERQTGGGYGRARLTTSNRWCRRPSRGQPVAARTIACGHRQL